MKQTSKMSLALHALGHLAMQQGQPMTSEAIARQNGTNPVVVRRVLGLLRQAGILRSDKGHDGGWQLARAADTITLADVHDALGAAMLTPPAMPAPGPCVVVTAMRQAVDAAMTEAGMVLRASLARRTVADLAGQMGRGDCAPQPPSQP